MGQEFKLDWQDGEDHSIASCGICVFTVREVETGGRKVWISDAYTCFGSDQEGNYIFFESRDAIKHACEEWLKEKLVATLRLWEPEEPTEEERCSNLK